MTLQDRHMKNLLHRAQDYRSMELIYGRQFDEEKACLAYIEEDEPDVELNQLECTVICVLRPAIQKLNSLIGG